MTAFTITQDQLNRSVVDKRVDRFYASFYKFPENISNLLGRQLVQMERPSVTFNTFQTKFKSTTQTNSAQLGFQPIRLQFKDDNLNLVNTVLYNQIFRQLGMLDTSDAQIASSTAQTFLNANILDRAKFDIGVKVYGPLDEIVEQYTIMGCFIVGITHSQNLYASSDNNLIVCQIAYNNYQLNYVDAQAPTNPEANII